MAGSLHRRHNAVLGMLLLWAGPLRMRLLRGWGSEYLLLFQLKEACGTTDEDDVVLCLSGVVSPRPVFQQCVHLGGGGRQVWTPSPGNLPASIY